MRTRQRCGRFGLVVSALLFFCIVQRVEAQSKTETSSSIADLKALSYHKIEPPNLSTLPSYQDIRETIRLARAYVIGNQLLPKYHEPIPTRGASGIAIFKSVAPSVVLVVVGDIKNQKFEPSGLGAGVIINSSGDILTNWHVINGYSGALIFFKPKGSLDVTNSDAFVARVVLQNQIPDLALLHLVMPPASLVPVPIGNIASVQVAEDIHVIGHPEGNLWSYTTGVVSQVRDGYTWSYSDGSKHLAKVLQLQTAINPGNSGGPVVDDQGNLLGLIAMGQEGQNLDYAIAADVIQLFLAGTASRTRSGTVEPKSPKAEYMAGRLQDGRHVMKIAYPDLTEYSVADEQGKPSLLFAETPDVTQVIAQEPNSFSGFGDWTIALRNGVSVRARGNGSVPDLFSSR
jgi:S1-C subfamily serine protease